MTLVGSGNLHLRGEGLEEDDGTNVSIAYEVYKYNDANFNGTDLLADAKDEDGVNEGFTEFRDFLGWARHNSKLFVTLTNFNTGCEVHVDDHTDPPPLGGDQLGDDVGSPFPDEVGELWGSGVQAGNTNNVVFTANGDVDYTSGLGIEWRVQTRSRYSSTWGSFGGWTGPYISTDIVQAMRESDAHFELRQTWGRLYASNFTSAITFQLDSGGTDFNTPNTDNITLKNSVNVSSSREVKFQTSGGADISGGSTPDDTEVNVRIFARTKNTSDAWVSVWPNVGQSYAAASYSFGYNSTANPDRFTCNFAVSDYLFEIQDA